MEDVLEVYQRRYEDNEVLVCLDETSKQQVKETRLPRPAWPGAAGSYDYEYERNGVSNLFMLFAPLEGWLENPLAEPLADNHTSGIPAPPRPPPTIAGNPLYSIPASHIGSSLLYSPSTQHRYASLRAVQQRLTGVAVREATGL